LGPKCHLINAAVRLGLLAFLAAGTAYADSGYVYAKVVGGTSPFAYAPFSFNPGGSISVQRTGTGVDIVTFTNSGIGTGWVALANAAGSASGDYCNVKTWSNSAVTVLCYGPGGAAVDTSYVVFAVSNANDKGIAFAWYNFASSPSSFYSYNLGGAISFQNLSNGDVKVTFNGLGATGGTVEVDALNTNDTCTTDGWTGSNVVRVSCVDTSGNSVESAFSIAVVPAGSAPTGLAYTFEDAAVVTLPNTPSGPTYNPTGYAVLLQRQSAGQYQVLFYGLSSVPVGGPGFVMATADGASARCNGNSWGQFGATAAYVANVYCSDSSGNFVDSKFEVLVLPPSAYAYASVSNPNGAVNQSQSLNPGGSPIVGTHLGTGSYQISFPNSGIGAGWAVQATSRGANFCNVGSWGSSAVNVSCYTPAGALTDTTFAILAVSSTNQEGIAFAWAGNPTAASYTPDPNYSYNPSGAISITRNSMGFYEVDFLGLTAGGGTVQVAAYGSSSTTCTSAGWTTPDFRAEVACYTAGGVSTDSPFVVAIVPPGATPPAVAYAWASLSSSASYTAPAGFSWDESGAVTITRSGTGAYHPSFPGASAFLQVTPYQSTARCAAPNSTSVQCYNMSGTAADAVYTAMAFSSIPSLPGSLTVHAGTAQSAVVGTNFANALSVLVKDQSGNPLPGAFVQFVAPTSGSFGTFNDPLYEFVSTVTIAADSNGVATAPAFEAQGAAGAFTVNAFIASYPAATTGVGFSLTVNPLTAVTLQTSPAGLAVKFNSSAFSAAPVTASLTGGTSQTIAAQSPQLGTFGMQYVWTGWSDGGALSHTITVPASNTTYTANFKTQYELFTGVSPSATGTVSVTSGTYFDANTNAAITAAPAAGFRFASWSGPVNNTSSASTTINMAAKESVTANFAQSCAVTGDANASVADVQAMINQALGRAMSKSDLNGDQVVNLVDVQIVIRAAQGGACNSI
jgi:hypothetical protein